MRVARNCLTNKRRTHVRSWRRYSSTTRKWFRQPALPYLNNEDYLNVLEEHVNLQPQSKILLVWGARSVSKSRGLQIKTEEWRKRGHTVIDIDLKGVPPTFGFFAQQFAQAIKSANLQVSDEERNTVHEQQKQRFIAEEKSRIEASYRELKDELKKPETIGSFIGNLFSVPLIPWRAMFKFGDLSKNLVQWSKGKLAPTSVEDFITLFQLLELHAKNSGQKCPIIIWREIQNLAELRNAPSSDWSQELYRRLFLHFEPRKQGTSRVPVIFESSDLLWARAQTTVSQESFRPYLLEAFKQEAARKLLVDTTLTDAGFKGPVFTEDEFTTIWEYSGGHQGTIYTLHNMLREGQTLADALADRKRQDYARLIGSINEVTSSEIANKKEIVKARDEFLVQLHKTHYLLNIKDITEHPAALHLVNKNVLFTDGKMIQPQYRAVEHAIREYLHLNNLISEQH